VLSPRIVAEVETALKLRQIRKYLREPDEAVLWLADLAAIADLADDTDRAKGVCRDPADDAVLSAAIEGRADVIDTGDADLLALEEHEGIAIVTPRVFLDLWRTR
jgi:putative PIN family toxin of toxin-antitoxin system